MRGEPLPRATRPLTDGHRVLLQILAESFVDELLGPEGQGADVATQFAEAMDDHAGAGGHA